MKELKKSDVEALLKQALDKETSKIQEEIVPKSKLTCKRHEPPQEQLIGRMQRTRYQYKLEGEPNSYVIRFDDVSYTNEKGTEESMTIDPLFYDLERIK